jgi:phosphatidylserine/phosphatidylglycerophosphate/cardiolipin synthase-like enzyme
MKLFFSNIKPIIVSELDSASKEILIAVSWLTDRELFAILLNKLKAGIRISIITRNDFLNNHPKALPWQQFIDLGGELRFCQQGNMLHYKFCVVDNVKAFATSYNWTCFAGNNNRENILLFENQSAITSFNDEFNYLCQLFPLESNPTWIEKQSVNYKLHGFYEVTIEEDEKNQKINPFNFTK